MNTLNYDLIIIGGGLVGAGLAAALRNSGLRLALVDARLPCANDPRLFALNNSSCQFLNNIGLWERLAPQAAPIQQVHVSNQGHFGTVRLHSDDVGLPSLGHVIPAHYIETALNDALLSLPHVTLYRPAKLTALTQQDGRATVVIQAESREKILHTPIVIGADGTDSTVRSQLDVATDIVDYKQSAIVTRTTLRRSHCAIAYERFTADGAIAMLPLPGNECATIWTARAEMASHLMTLSDDAFLQVLQKEFGYRLGRLQHISKRHVFSLRFVRVNKAVDQCVFLLGNAAHTFHPIAAQGFNLALYEVALLVDAILEKTKEQQAFTAADLQTISAATEQQQSISVTVSDRLARVFSKQTMPLSIALQFGMIGMNVITPLKKKFIEGIMGKAKHTPSLLMHTV